MAPYKIIKQGYMLKEPPPSKRGLRKVSIVAHRDVPDESSATLNALCCALYMFFFATECTNFTNYVMCVLWVETAFHSIICSTTNFAEVAPLLVCAGGGQTPGGPGLFQERGQLHCSTAQ